MMVQASTPAPTPTPTLTTVSLRLRRRGRLLLLLLLYSGSTPLLSYSYRAPTLTRLLLLLLLLPLFLLLLLLTPTFILTPPAAAAAAATTTTTTSTATTALPPLLCLCGTEVTDTQPSCCAKPAHCQGKDENSVLLSGMNSSLQRSALSFSRSCPQQKSVLQCLNPQIKRLNLGTLIIRIGFRGCFIIL